MERLNFVEQKISLAQTILALKDINLFVKIQTNINELYNRQNKVKKFETDFDAKKLSFEQWNKQFDDNCSLDDYIPEYGMKLFDFRLKIYNSEKEEGMTKLEFINKINSWK